MRSNRAIQTIIQAVLLVMVAAIAFRLSNSTPGSPGEIGSPSPGGPPVPDLKKLARAYREYFDDDPEIAARATLLSIQATDVSMDGSLAHVKLVIEFKWTGHNPAFTVGPLKNAAGGRGDNVKYTEIFTYRYWTQSQKWDIEGRP